MKLSILDQVPVSTGQTEKEALEQSITLAKLGEELGFERFWIAEHHDLFGLACPNPAVMLGAIGAQTDKIHLGAGAVLLPYYKPFHVAETYNLLATLYPGRIDIGLGRAPGGPAEVSMALSDNYLASVREYPAQIDELQMFIDGTWSKDDAFSKVKPTPVPEIPPHLWVLGTSEKSALLAAEKKMDYVFGHFMTDGDGPAIVQAYRDKSTGRGKVIIAVHVICADTTEEAEKLSHSYLLWKERQQDPSASQKLPSLKEAASFSYSEEQLKQLHKSIVIGDAATVRTKLQSIADDYKTDELMIVTITHDFAAKMKSYTLLAQIFKKDKE